ncbi:glycosyltransferase family 39 protein [Candidatus Daviesbacteria bacterium]|nr:glycosyltransferase family 39 protein [Candidatus Daviesbacteria bacterium]
MKKIFLLLFLLTCVGGFLRFYHLTSNPPSLNIDEVAYGYDAYSILKTGRDQYGNFLPLFFKSVGDYKNPILIYSMVPSIYLFGLNEFSVRFSSALAGTLSIPLLYFLISSVLKKKKIALLGSMLITISPWHIYYSRFASDHLMGLFFLIIGAWFFQKMLDQGKLWWILSAFFLSISVYTYHSQRVFIPLFVLADC